MNAGNGHPMEHCYVTLKEIVHSTSGGASILTKDYTAEGVPVLTKGDVKSPGRVVHGGKYVDAQTVAQKKWKYTEPDDFIVTTRDLSIEANFLGLVSSIPNDRTYIINQGATKFKLNESLIDRRYFIYWCADAEFRHHIQSHYSGSTQIHIRQDDLFSAPVKLLELPQQKAIAHILGTLDDKIELNSQTNKTLESITQAIFKSWFVDFDPVRAKRDDKTADLSLSPEILDLFPDSFQDSELGEIPVGWEQGTVGNYADNVRKSVSVEGIQPDDLYIALNHMPRKSITLADWTNANIVTSNKSRFKKGDILFGKLRPYFHKVGIAPIAGICSTDILVCRAKEDVHREYVLMLLSSEDIVEHASNVSTGTRMPRAKWTDLANYPIALPTSSVLEEYSRITAPFIDKIWINIWESRSLDKLRDTLLPKLISGELRIKDAEKFLKDAPL